jgi:hypothetical protein
MWVPGARACACAHVHVALLTQARNAYAPYCDVICDRSPPHFSLSSRKRCDFRKKVSKHKMCVFIFSRTFV